MTSPLLAVAIVDDDPHHRGALASTLTQSERVRRVVAVAHPRELPTSDLDIVVLDLVLDSSTEEVSTAWIPELVAAGARVVVYSEATAPLLVEAAIHAGASCFIHKSQTVLELVRVVTALADDEEVPLGPVANAILARKIPLAPNQVKVLEGVRAGLSNEVIGRRLHLQTQTVAKYVGDAIARFRDAGVPLEGRKPRVALGDAAREQGIGRLDLEGR